MRLADAGAYIKRIVSRQKAYVLPPLLSRPSPNHSSRNGERVTLIVVHDTEGGYAGSVNWLCDPRAQASAHVILREDGGQATQIVGWEDKAWACVAYNGRSDNLELAGFASKPYSQAQLGTAARIVADRLHVRGLKPIHSTVAGFCYHSDLGQAGGGHHDPGFSPKQKAWFEAQVKYEYERGGFRPTWGFQFTPQS